MADQTTKTLLLKIKSETGGIKDLSTAFAEAEKDAKASLDAQVKAINDLVKATEKAKKEEAKAAKEAAAEQSKQQKELLKEELAATRERNKQLAAEAKAQAKEAVQLAKDQARQVADAAKETSQKSNAQAKYAEQRIKDEELLANRVRKIEIDSLKQTIEERNGILNAASKQRLGTAIGDITSAESSDRKKLLRSLREDMTERAKLQQEEFNLVERGLQQTRVREAERARIEETAARQRLERQAATNRQLLANETDFNERQRQNQLRGMRTSATEAFAPTPTARLSPFTRVPEDVIRSHESLFARIGQINLEYRIWNTLINTVNSSLSAIPKIGVELEATRAVLTATMGSEAGVSSAMRAIHEEAKRTGISIETLRESFRNFHASTSLAGQSLDSTWKMFTNLNTVSTALHLTTDQTNHVFLALSQIFNKSKVQSEELVKQLGNLLPGAFASFQKANKDAYASTMSLSEAMKKGTVFAKDTVEKFTEYMATKFAASFAVASDGLNANIGRMKNSFTELGEAVYGLSGGPMIAFTKGMTSMADYMTAAVKGENDFLTVTKSLAEVLSGVLVATLIGPLQSAIVAVMVKIEALIGTMALARASTLALGNALLALSGPAVVAGLVAVIAHIRDIGMAQASVYQQATERFREFEREKTKADLGKKLEIRVEASDSVTKARKDLKDLQTELTRVDELSKKGATRTFTGREGEGITGSSIPSALAQLNVDIAKQRELIDGAIITETTKIKKAQNDAQNEIVMGGSNLTEKAHALRVAALKAEGKDVEAAAEQFKNTYADTVIQAQKAIEEGKKILTTLTDPKQTPEPDKDRIDEIKAAITKNEQIISDAKIAAKGAEESAQTKLDKKATAVAKTVAAERLRDIKEAMGQEADLAKTAAIQAKATIDELETKRSGNLISFEGYLAKKQAALTKDYEAERAYYEQQKSLAEQSGKVGLVTQAEEKLKQLEIDFKAKSSQTKDVAATATKDYETNLASIHERYQDILGIERDSNELTSIKIESLRQQILLEIEEKGVLSEISTERLKELDTLKEALNLKSKFRIYEKETATAEKIHTDAISRINQLEQVGQVSSLSATMARTKANERLLEIRQKDVDLARQALDEARPEARPAAQDKYDIAKQKLESLKLVANETGAMIEQSLGNAFDRSFTGLITNTMTAKQAFKSFATSIVEDIARIIAQEVRSAILRPILRMGLSALGGLFTSSLGSVGSVGDGSINLETTPFEGGINYNAKGGIYSGAGISRHSGTIVNSPTVFPFAKGVGLMGEAGPEAILPLKRNSQGKLGVSVDNTGQPRGSNIYYINTTVNAGSNATPDSIATKASETIMRAIAKQEINSAARPGNRLNQITKYGY
jgi:hypothetical protein